MNPAIFGIIAHQALAVPNGRRSPAQRQLEEWSERMDERRFYSQARRECLDKLDAIRNEAKACFTLDATPEQKLRCLEKALNK